MPRSCRYRAPKLEPELLERCHGSASLGGTTSTSDDIDRVAGASVSRVSGGNLGAARTITLCDGSQFTFARLVDLQTSADT